MHLSPSLLSVLLATIAPLASGQRGNVKQCSLPSGSNTVKVSILNPSRFQGSPPSLFIAPDINGTAMSDIPSFATLIEHENKKSGKKTKLLFDLGLRKDWENLPPGTVAAIKAIGTIITSNGDPASQLRQNGIKPDSISSIIFSHSHFDHVGDATLFPSSTSIIVGPGFKQANLPAYPDNPNSPINQDGFNGREVKELSFNTPSTTVASLPAIDVFGDGSFYLLSTPGHDIGHLSALARTTKGRRTEDDTFILLGGDSTHHCGAFRPTAARPLPRDIPRRQHLLDIHPQHSPYEPFYHPSSGGFNLNATEMDITLGKIEQLDASPNVLTVIAHDRWLLDVIDLFPKSANDWQRRGWGDKTHWRFVQDFA